MTESANPLPGDVTSETNLPGRVLFALGGVAYAVSLALPAYDIRILDTDLLYGVHCLLAGVPFYPTNVLTLSMFVFLKSVRGLYGWILASILFGTGVAALVMGAITHFKHVHVGFYVWASSLLVLGVAALVATLSRRAR